MKILHTADLHLQDNAPQRWEALQELVDLACREMVEALIISGDLFDQQVDAELLRPRLRQILAPAGFTTIIIPGNHDCGAYRSGLYFGDQVKIITSLDKPVDTGAALIWGLPYEHYSGEQVAYLLQNLSGKLSREVPNILLYHGELLDAYFSRWDWGSEGEQRYMPAKLSFFQGIPVDYVLAGHFHSRFAVWDLPEGGYFVYPGSPVAITSREKGRRKANLFKLGEAPGENLLTTFHLEQIEIELEPGEDPDLVAQLTERLSEAHPSAELLLTVSGFINSQTLGISEQDLVAQVKQIAGDRLYEEAEFLFRDISNILEDGLYKAFIEKLELLDCPPEQRRNIKKMVIRAMAGARK
ncbi:MAG TPA: DNA repair exonuclease [Firmicutes bacterium]|nr:DNA repair exonuclease [Bacillota bacterium]